MLKELNEMYARYLKMAIDDIATYTNEQDIWKVAPGINNSGGNLALHLAGNLRLFIGAILGDTPYERDRDAEFSLKDIPQTELISLLTITTNVVTATLEKMEEGSTAEIYPTDKFGAGKTINYVLFHLLAHLAYHQGQINYHRRLLNK